MMAAKRIKRDLTIYQADQVSYSSMCHFEPESEDNLLQLKGYVHGPPDTPYQGGIFHLRIKVPERYPFSPPEINMVTKVWHPNIQVHCGTICLDVLENNWRSTMNIPCALLSIQALLGSPNPDNYLKNHVALCMLIYPDEYEKTASFWTYHYAVTNKTAQMISDFAPFEEKINQVMKARAGTSYEKALAELSIKGWNSKNAFKPGNNCAAVIKKLSHLKTSSLN